MLIKIILGLVILYAIYSLIPTIYYKYIHKEAFQDGVLSLSFDDGPNPLYTPRVLDLLDENKVTGYFFQVGEKIKIYPDITKDLVARGHILGLHCYHHTHPALWGPLRTYRDMKKALEVLEGLGLRPKYYRPPHGWVNLSMLFLIKKWQMDLKLWTCLPGDWEEEKPWEETFHALVKEGKKGGLVCLHDSNHKLASKSQAPENTIKALEKYFKER